MFDFLCGSTISMKLVLLGWSMSVCAREAPPTCGQGTITIRPRTTWAEFDLFGLICVENNTFGRTHPYSWREK